MFLSVIIPLYNCNQFLERCVDSIYRQELDNGEFEVIIVDDGSTDGGDKLADELAAKHDNMVVIHQDNSGVAFARNKGVDCAAGKYIHFVDPDDFVLDGCYHYIQSLSGQNFDVMCMSYIVDATLGTSMTKCTVQKKVGNGIEALNNLFGKGYVWDKFFKTEFLKKYNLSFPPLSYCQDMVFTLKVLECPCSVLLDNAKIYSYTTNPNGTVRANNVKNVRKKINALIDVNKYLDNFYTTHASELRSQSRRVFFYRILFSRVISLPLGYSDTIELFAKCRSIEVNKYARKHIDVLCYMFLYKHPLFYYLIQRPLSALYFLTRKNSSDAYGKERVTLESK